MQLLDLRWHGLTISELLPVADITTDIKEKKESNEVINMNDLWQEEYQNEGQKYSHYASN